MRHHTSVFSGAFDRRPLRRRFGAGIGLLFLTGAVSDLVHAPLAPWRQVVVSLALAGFVGLYLALLPPARRFERNCRLSYPAGIAGLYAFAAIALAAGAPRSFLALFIYVVAAGGMLMRPRVAVVITACTAGAAAAIGPSIGATGSATGSIVLTTLAIGLMMISFGRQVRTNNELVAARGELARLAVSEERLRIARDLHDLLGHSLSVVSLKTELAAKLLERDVERAAAELADVQRVTRQALVEVRDAVQGYRRLALSDALVGAREALAAAGIACRVEGSDVDLPEDVESVLAWAVREATTNVVRHSGARACTIRIHADEGTVDVEVADDGPASAPNPGGSGLPGLAERAARLRGTLEAGRRPEGGFQLRVSLPLAA